MTQHDTPDDRAIEPTVDPDDDSGQALSPRPTPVAEPPEPSPGGPHAVPGVGGDGAYSTFARDLTPESNPVTEDLPAETVETEDTDTAATRDEEPPPPEQESPA